MGPKANNSENGFTASFKKFFLRGVGALLPTLLTIAILIWAYTLVDDYIGQYITQGFIAVLARTAGIPTTVGPDDALEYGTRIGELDSDGRWLTREYQLVRHPAHRPTSPHRPSGSLEYRTALWRIAFAKYKLGLVGFLLAIALVYFVGFFVASFIGRAAWGLLERFQQRVPLVNAIYPYVKQITDFLLSESRVAFHSVVAVEYPRKGIWSLGLVTGEGMRALAAATQEDLVTIFIPNSPTPVTGYVITVPRSDVIELPLSIDEALRFTVSGGVIRPGGDSSETGKGSLVLPARTASGLLPEPAPEAAEPSGPATGGSGQGLRPSREDGPGKAS